MSPDEREPRHPIGVVSDRTGLSPHVLRAWERRYGAVSPERTDGGHRLYSDAELHRLRLLALLTDEGRKIGRIATLPDAELEELAAEHRREREADPGATEAPDRLLGEAREAVERLDGAGLEWALRRAAVQLGAHRFLEDVAAPFLREIGDRWHRGEIRPAHEHLASAAVTGVLHWLIDRMGPGEDAPGLVVGTPTGERHQVGALLAAAAAASAGWRVTYLGAELPPEDFVVAARETGARAVALSIVFTERGEETAVFLREIRRALPARLPVIVGGAGAPAVEGGEAGEITRLGTLEELERMLSVLAS